MLKFKALELSDQQVFRDYLKGYPFNTYEYSFLTLYLWRHYCHVQYAVFNNTLIVMKREPKKGTYFMQPIGYADQSALQQIIALLVAIKPPAESATCLFRDVEEPFLGELKALYGDRLVYAEDEKNFDYIYDTQRLIKLAGEKLHKKKNLYNQFVRGYSHEVKDLRDDGVAQDCMEFSKRWLDSQKIMYKEIIWEHEGVKDILTHLDALREVMGLAVYVDGRIAGFTLGEILNRDMAVIHVEKGDVDIKGIYAFINRTFAERYLQDVRFVNREEDLGMVKLKKAKQAYDPVRLEKKYIANLS